MIKFNRANLLKDVLQGTGFVRRGAAFFRVWGDGVLQVLKFEHQRGLQVDELRIGIFSMYGELLPQWFTSGGCIPRGSIANFVGLRCVEGWLSPNCFIKTDNGLFFYKEFPVSIDSKVCPTQYNQNLIPSKKNFHIHLPEKKAQFPRAFLFPLQL